jgi:hypothetical protein
MVSHHTKLKKTAKVKAEKAREKGLTATVSKLKKGYAVSVTRKK